MAETVPIPGTNEAAKIREPVAPWLLGIVTLGIYHYFWWYYINDELRHLGEARDEPELGTNPALSVVALIFAWLVIPFIWTVVTTTKRIQRAQRLVGVDTTNGWIAALLWIFTFGIGGLIYTQSGMNRIWRGVRGSAAPPARQQHPDLDRLKQLADLRDSGALSQEEFEAEKARLGLGGEGTATP